MKSVLKVKILGIDYYTMKQVSVKKNIECDGFNFIDKVIPPFKINNGEYELTESICTAKEQADEWLSGQRDFFKNIIYEQDLNCIINWEILSIENFGLDNLKSDVLSLQILIPINKKIKLSEIEKIEIVIKALQNNNVEFTEDFKNNFLHTYQEMKEVLGGISNDKKILIVLRAMGVGLMSSINSYNRMLNLYKSL
jgi:hypothetical protein